VFFVVFFCIQYILIVPISTRRTSVLTQVDFLLLFIMRGILYIYYFLKAYYMPKKTLFLLKITVLEIKKRKIPHELFTVKLRSEKPFMKKQVEEFIGKQDLINNAKKVAEAEDSKIKVVYMTTDME